jgi:signal transduction histidine kinase
MYRDSVLNEETENKVKELQYNYDLQKKQTEIELLAKDKAIAQSRAEKQNAISVGLVSGLVLLVIIIAVMYRSRQKEVAAKNMITEQAARLGELNNYKDKIFSVLAHDLRGPIGALSSAVTMLDEKMISPKEFSELNPLVRRQLTSVTLLLDNLLKWSMSHMAMEQPLKKEKTALLKLVSQNISLVQYDIDMKGIVIENNVTENTTATGNAGNIDIIIRNLISNAVKFTNHGGKIIINAVLSDDKVSLSVIDNGVGIDDEQLKQLFAAMTGNSTVGTKGERGVGLGLLMSKEFAKANDGDITVCSKPGKGSTFTLILPA